MLTWLIIWYEIILCSMFVSLKTGKKWWYVNCVSAVLSASISTWREITQAVGAVQTARAIAATAPMWMAGSVVNVGVEIHTTCYVAAAGKST